MSIGAALADARRAAGLTVAEVSARTRIRAALIRAIESDDFGPCGGDFYARGHIRAIARVVGTEAGPLVAAYDTAHPEGRPATLEDLLGHPPAPAGQPHPEPRSRPEPRPGKRAKRALPWPPAPLTVLAGVALAVIGGGAYQLAAGSGPTRAATAGTPPAAGTPGIPRNGSPVPAPSSPAAPPSAASPPPSPSPPPTATITRVTPSIVSAVGPGGTADGDNPGDAGRALSGDPGSPWRSHWYTTAAFGNLQQGTGLLFTLPRTVTAAAVTIRMADPGASLQIRAGTSPGSLRTVASAPSAGADARLPLASRPRVRYLVVWFTRLPPDGNGTYQAAVYGLTVTAGGRR